MVLIYSYLLVFCRATSRSGGLNFEKCVVCVVYWQCEFEVKDVVINEP